MTGRKAENLTGKRFGGLTALWRAPNRVEPNWREVVVWLCLCDCGNSVAVRAAELKRGKQIGCGCQKGKGVKHGKSSTRIYRIWHSMRQRCENPNAANFARYGGQGVTVCDRWKDFSAFYADMGDPEDWMTLERIDNAKGYEPGNVRWASHQEQAENRRTSRYLTHAGKTLTLSQWAKLAGMNKQTFSARLARGWTVERILTEPLR